METQLCADGLESAAPAALQTHEQLPNDKFDGLMMGPDAEMEHEEPLPPAFGDAGVKPKNLLASFEEVAKAPAEPSNGVPPSSPAWTPCKNDAYILDLEEPEVAVLEEACMGLSS